MANSFILPTVGTNQFVASDAFVVNRGITAESLSVIPSLTNYNHAYLNTGTIISQQFRNGVLYNTTNGSYRPSVLRYRVPLLSDRHFGWRVILRYSTPTTTLPLVRWKVTSDNGSIAYTSHTLNLTGGASILAYSTATITNNTNAIGSYKTFELELQNSIIIHSIDIEATPLTSPLTTISSAIRGSDNIQRAYIPMDSAIFEENSPLSSAKMDMVIGGVQALQQRKRLLFALSGVDLSYDSITNPYSTMITRPQKGLLWADIHNLGSTLLSLPYFLNPHSIEYTITIWYFALSQITDFNIYILGNPITIPAGSTGWYSSSFVYRPSYPVIKEMETIDGITPKSNLILASDTLIRSSGNRVDALPIASLCIFGV